jgi:iron(III) transport system permease protein
MLLVAAVVSVAILGPLAVVVWRSVQVDQSLLVSTYSLDNYARLAVPRTLAALGNSLLIATGSGLLACVWGVALAWIVTRTNVPLRGLLYAANPVPFFISPLLSAIAWSYLASPTVGLLNKPLLDTLGLADAPFDVYSLLGIVWVLGIAHVPLVYLFCVGALSQMDPALEHAARVSGASSLGVLLRVTLPLAAPAILSSLVLCFVLGLEDLGTPLVLGYGHGIQTISTQIYDGIQKSPSDYNFGAALGCVLMLLTVAGILLQRRLMAGRSYATIGGRGYRPEQLDLGPGRYLALAFNLFYLTAAVLLPIGTLVIVSFSRAWLGYVDPSQFTPQYYVYLATTNPIAFRAVRNSLFLAAVGATVAVALAFVVAYVIHRTRSWARGWLDLVTTVPIGVPGLVMAIGIFVALLRTPLYGTLWVLLVAYLIRYIPYGQRTVSAAIVSVAAELEESARMSGAGWLTTMRRVFWPLLRPGLVAAWLLLFITFMREVSMSLLLARSGTETLSTALYSLLTYDPTGASSAFTVVQVVMILAVALVFLRVARGENVRV